MLNVFIQNLAFDIQHNYLHEDRHPHTYHALNNAQLGTKIRLRRIHSPGTS